MEKNIANDIDSVYKKVINSGFKLPPGIYPNVECFMSSLKRLKQVADERKFEQTASVLCRALESVTLKCLQNGYKEAIYSGNEFLARQCKTKMMELKSRRTQDEVVTTGSTICQPANAPKRFAYAESLINVEYPNIDNNFQDGRNVKDLTSSNPWPFASKLLKERDLPCAGTDSSKTNLLLFQDRRPEQSETCSKRWTFASKLLDESDISRAGTSSSKTKVLFQEPHSAQSETSAKQWTFASKLLNETVQPEPCSVKSKSSDILQATSMKERHGYPSEKNQQMESDSIIYVPCFIQSSNNSKYVGNNNKKFNSSGYIPTRNDFGLNTFRPISDTVIGSHSRGVNKTIIPSKNNTILPFGNTKALVNPSCKVIEKSKGICQNKATSIINPSTAQEVKSVVSKRTPGLKNVSMLHSKKSLEKLSKFKSHGGVESIDKGNSSINCENKSSNVCTKSKNKEILDKEEKKNNSISNRRKSVGKSKTNIKNNDIMYKDKQMCEQSPKERKKSKHTPGSLKQNNSNLSKKQRLKSDTLSTPVRRYSKLNKTLDSVIVNRNKRKHDSEYLSEVNSTLRPRAKRFRALSLTPGTIKSSCKNVTKSRRHKDTVDSKVSCTNSMDNSAGMTDMSSAYNETPKSTMSNRRGNFRILYKRNLFSTPRDRIKDKWLK